MDKDLQTRLEARLSSLVRLPTTTEDIATCRQSIGDIAAELKNYGFTTHVDGPTHPWLVATTKPTKTPTILIVMHLDVVPPSHDSHFAVRSEDDKLYGRGVFDMKFAIAGTLELARDIAATGNLADYDFGIVITTDEETGGEYGTREVLAKGYRAKAAVIPDGGRDWNIEQRAKGFRSYWLRAKTTGGHSSRPQKGNNALLNILPALGEINERFKNEDLTQLTVGVNSLITPNSHTKISTQTPHEARSSLDIRAYSLADMDEAESLIKSIAKKYSLQLEKILERKPVILDKSSKYTKAFVAALTDELGTPPGWFDALGSSDACYFSEHDIPCLLVYPRGGEAHGLHEWLQRGDLTVFYNLLHRYLLAVAYKN